jgi:hypothetical protein
MPVDVDRCTHFYFAVFLFTTLLLSFFLHIIHLLAFFITIIRLLATTTTHVVPTTPSSSWGSPIDPTTDG